MDFFYSPGFGGAAAVVAAGVALLVARLRRRTEKEERKLDREADARQRRWDRFTFILLHQTELGPTVVLAALVRLSEEAAASADPSLGDLIDDFTLTLISDAGDQHPGPRRRLWRTLNSRPWSRSVRSGKG